MTTTPTATQPESSKVYVDGACVFAWTDGMGTEVGRANFANEIGADARVTVRLHNGRERDGFTTPDAALAWIAENV